MPKIDSAAAEIRRVNELKKALERLRAKGRTHHRSLKKIFALLGRITGDMPSETK